MKPIHFSRAPERAIIYILHSGNMNGTERMALATLEGLREYEERVVFAPGPKDAGSVATVAAESGIRSVRFESHWQLLTRLMPWFLKHRQLDIIDVGVGSGWICHVLGRVFQVRLRQLQVAHGGTEDTHAYGRKAELNNYPVLTVAVSDFVKQRLLAHKVRPDRIAVINNFLSTSQRGRYRRRTAYDAECPPSPSVDGRKFRVAVVSRIDAIKRIDVLIATIERHGLTEFQFDIYGTGNELTALSRRTAGFSNIRFRGYQSDVADRLVDSDLLLHLCPEEPFGLVILEAFATGVVVVVPDTGGASSLVEDGQTGFRFVANDVDDLCRVLKAAMATPPEQLQRMADAGIVALETRFSQPTGTELYRQALAFAGRVSAQPSRKFVDRRVPGTGAPRPPAGIGERRRAPGMSQAG